MKTSQFEAKTLGVGELITQRKLFRVPPHQRSYAWDTDSVELFLEDIRTAFTTKASEYFIGLVVIQGPVEGEWVLLDGQQRLTTTSLIFAAIRNWLWANNFVDDSKQIHNEYLGVRRLGGDLSSRMLLNVENQVPFESAALKETSIEHLKVALKQQGKKQSNKLILEAAIACQQFIEDLTNSIAGSLESKARALFDLALFLDSKVKVVCVEVSSDIDAYVLFESLNDRAVELSALDLIKNYVLSKALKSDLDRVGTSWQELINTIEDRNPDDFLKVFWTSRRGTIQKAQIFRRLRQEYTTTTSVEELMRQLQSDADLLAMIEESNDPAWNNWPKEIHDQILILREMNARQTRPVLLAAFRHLKMPLFQSLLWQLTVAIIRFQIVGRGRTGVVEKVLGRLCIAISNNEIKSSRDAREILSELDIPTPEFIDGFASLSETKFARISYFLGAITIYESYAPDLDVLQLASLVRKFTENKFLAKQLGPSALGDEVNQIGNFLLENESDLLAHIDGTKPEQSFTPNDINNRSIQLAQTASKIWVIPE